MPDVQDFFTVLLCPRYLLSQRRDYSTGSCRAILGDSLSSASYKNCRANMQAVIMPQRREAVRHEAMKTMRKSPKGLSAARATLLQTRCEHTANQQLY